jgi:transcriptional regulator with XRE-family HTH domain
MPARNPELAALGAALCSARRSARLTQRTLAARAGISASHVCAIERGEADPTFDTLLDLADGLGVRLGQLFSAAEVDRAVDDTGGGPP